MNIANFVSHKRCLSIFRFLWGVGTHPERDDIVKVRNLTQYETSGCTPANLQHNMTYYSTVVAYNHALNSKATNGSSDGGKP